MSDDGKVLKLAKLTVLSVISAGCAINFAVVAQISYGREWQRLPDGTLVEVANGEEGDIQWFTIVIALAGVFSLLFYAYAIMEMYKHPEKMDTTHPFQRKLNIAILCCAAPLAALCPAPAYHSSAAAKSAASGIAAAEARLCLLSASQSVSVLPSGCCGCAS